MSATPPDGDQSSELTFHLEQSYAELGGLRDRFVSLYHADDHRELVNQLRGDTRFALTVARADSITYLRKWFTRTDGWNTVDDRSGASGAAGVAVEWTYAGVHDRDAMFNSLSPTGRPVIVRGVTMMGLEKGRMQLYRYVDWAGVFAQLGLSLNWRVPVPSRLVAQPDGATTGGPAAS